MEEAPATRLTQHPLPWRGSADQELAKGRAYGGEAPATRRLTQHPLPWGGSADQELAKGRAYGGEAPAWTDERQRLLDKLARRVKEANELKAQLAAVDSQMSQLRTEAQRSAKIHKARTAELEANAQQAKVQLQEHEGEREAMLRRCAELQRRAVGVTIVTQDLERQREDIAAVTVECAQVRDRLSHVATELCSQVQREDVGVERDDQTGVFGRDGSGNAAHYISDGVIRGTTDLFRVLVDLQERLVTPPPRQQTAEESAEAERTASRWELEYACGRAERQREALQLELESEQKTVENLRQQLLQLTNSDIRTGNGASAELEGKLAEALQRNSQLVAEKDAAESKLRLPEHDDGGATAGDQIQTLTRQLTEARAHSAAADEREKVASQRCEAMEHELAKEKQRYDQLRLQVDNLLAATTNVTNAVASPWHSPRLVSRSPMRSPRLVSRSPTRSPRPGSRSPRQLQETGSNASYGIDDAKGSPSSDLRQPVYERSVTHR